ncbi:MAG TPA: hypothetical protein VGU66_19760 [Candidatus Elarobacter sp.]|nr:hypothetical protein [Candidatus Elarobacter sp.]
MTLDELSPAALRLCDEISQYDSRAVVAAILFIEDEKIRRHSEHGGPIGEIAYAEYAALLSLRPTPARSTASPTLAEVEHIITEINKLFTGVTQYYYSTQTDTTSDTASLEEKLQARVRTAGLLIRNPGNPDYWVSLLKTFSQDFDPRVEDALGVSVHHIIGIAETFLEVVSDKYKRFEKLLRDREQALTPLHEGSEHLSADSYVGSPGIAASAWTDEKEALSAIITFSSAEIMQRSVFSAQQIEDFVSIFSMSRIDVDLEHILLPTPLSPITRTPLIHDITGFYCPNPVLLAWAILPRLSTVLNPANNHPAANQSAYHRFQSKLAQFVEQITASILSEVGITRVETNLTYPLVDTPGRTEVDVVGLIDRSLVVAECKAIFVSDATIRGGIASMKRDLRDTLANTQRQGERAIAAAATDALQSFDGSGTHNYRDDFDDSILLLVLLDNYPVISSAAIEIAETGYLGERPGVPVTLLDLYEVSAYLREPWLWKNYFEQRAAAIARSYKTMALDETDFLALYVLSGRIGGEHTLFVGAAESVLRDRYREANGDVYKFMSLGASSKQLIQTLVRTRPRRWTDAVGRIIEHRAEFEQRLSNQLALVRQKKGRRGIVLCAENDVGFAVIPYHGIPAPIVRKSVPIRLRELVPSAHEWMIVYWNLSKATTSVSFLSGQAI